MEELEIWVPKKQYETTLAILLEAKGEIAFGNSNNSFKIGLDSNIGKVLDHLDENYIEYTPIREEIERKYWNYFEGESEQMDIFNIFSGVI